MHLIIIDILDTILNQIDLYVCKKIVNFHLIRHNLLIMVFRRHVILETLRHDVVQQIGKVCKELSFPAALFL